MAYAKPRSMNGDLELGMVDGKYRMVVKDRGGVVETSTYDSRRDLNDTWYGLHEAPTMDTPDCGETKSPYAQSTHLGVQPESF